MDFTQRLLDGFWIPAAQTKVLGGIYSFLAFFQLRFFKNTFKNASRLEHAQLSKSVEYSLMKKIEVAPRHAIDSFFRTTDVL